MLCCNVKFISLQNFIIRSKFCSDVSKESYCLIKVYFVPDQFSVNGFFLFYLVCCFFFNPLPICSQGEGKLISRFSPGAEGFGMIWSGPLSDPPICPRSWGGGGFNWLVHNTALNKNTLRTYFFFWSNCLQQEQPLTVCIGGAVLKACEPNSTWPPAMSMLTNVGFGQFMVLLFLYCT